MENEKIIIDPTIQPEKVKSANDHQLKLIDELNDKIADKNGEWMYSRDFGIVWVPNVSVCPMPSSEPTREYHLPEEKTLPPLLASIVEWGKTYDFDNIPKNAVVIIKLNVDDPVRAQMMQRIIAKQVLEPRVETLKQNRVCILFMQDGDDISIMTEEEMGQAGWEKKEKKRIITLS